jgi:uncharacterized protein
MRRLAVLVPAALAAVFALAAPALAHVTVTAPGATRGGSDQEITFRVPVEKQVHTVGFTLALPTATPIASVLVEPLPGWTHTEKTAKLAHPIKTDDGEITTAVAQISWRATGRGLAPGEFGAFTIIAGQLPDAGSLTFRALQRYADGSVVAWNQVAAPGSSAEPENPAPVLTLARAASHGVASTATAAAKAPSNTGPVVLSIVALVIAAGALGLAFVSRARSRS